MISLDHTILRVADLQQSVRFYTQVMGFTHEGPMDRFEIVRVHPRLTLDLVQQTPRDSVHLAFAMSRGELEAIQRALDELGLAYGNEPHSRGDRRPAPRAGAGGLADALYFDDPDGHVVEIRTYEPRSR